MIYDYTLENGRCPSWIEDGGYYKDPSNNKMIGYSTVNEDLIPDTSVKYTKDELITRVLNIHASYPLYKTSVLATTDDQTLTNAEVTASVQTCAASRRL